MNVRQKISQEKEKHISENHIPTRIHQWASDRLDVVNKCVENNNPLKNIDRYFLLNTVICVPRYLNRITLRPTPYPKNKYRQNDEEHCINFAKYYLINGCSARAASLAIGDGKFYSSQRSHLYLKNPIVMRYLEEMIEKTSEDIGVTFNWIAKKLKHCVDICMPDNAVTKDDIYVKGLISAASELNKMFGYYNDNSKGRLSDIDILNKSNEVLERVLEMNKKEY